MPAIPFAVAAVSKLALYTLCTSVQVEGLEHLVAALASGKGVLTSESDRIAALRHCERGPGEAEPADACGAFAQSATISPSSTTRSPSLQPCPCATS